MEQSVIDTTRVLREQLHGLAERSGEEKRTKAHLMRFLDQNTSLLLEDYGLWLCAVHEEPGAKETIAFRADMDALPYLHGARHLCGHDGHCAALAGLGLWLEGKRLDRNILLLFQHAEETGQGAKVCREALTRHGVRRIYAFHNIPGYGQGVVLLRQGAFACASSGMTIRFDGTPSHAAYPEYGHNPGYAAAGLMTYLPALAREAGERGMTMATLVGARIGEKAFGSAACSAEVYVTVRAWLDDDMQRLISSIEKVARSEAEKDGVGVSVAFCDEFPATRNDEPTLLRLKEICREEKLRCVEVEEPFRWSEDFGHYGGYAKAVMVGIGAGEHWPQLHTENYVFNDAILPFALTLFAALAQKG